MYFSHTQQCYASRLPSPLWPARAGPGGRRAPNLAHHLGSLPLHTTFRSSQHSQLHFDGFFFSVALQHDQWQNMTILQFYVGASKKMVNAASVAVLYGADTCLAAPATAFFCSKGALLFLTGCGGDVQLCHSFHGRRNASTMFDFDALPFAVMSVGCASTGGRHMADAIATASMLQMVQRQHIQLTACCAVHEY